MHKDIAKTYEHTTKSGWVGECVCVGVGWGGVGWGGSDNRSKVNVLAKSARVAVEFCLCVSKGFNKFAHRTDSLHERRRTNSTCVRMKMQEGVTRGRISDQ
jgi:hypothetical protein